MTRHHPIIENPPGIPDPGPASSGASTVIWLGLITVVAIVAWLWIRRRRSRRARPTKENTQ